MSSNRNQRRAGPTSLTPHPKPIITVEDWELKAPLDELEVRSVGLIRAACEKAPLPLKVSFLSITQTVATAWWQVYSR